MQSHRTFFYFVFGIAVVGLLFVAWALLRPHHTGVVTRVGPVGTATHTSGTGRRRHTYKGYSADVKVRIVDTGETVTVHYRAGKREKDSLFNQHFLSRVLRSRAPCLPASQVT